ncbi:acyltransferase family protein [Kosakonia sp. YIM B13605]|uniref:acyltransferase family protein n=1 Tax=Kosakonia TaxID=1330547 RepID=UPI0028A7FB2D|nr:acyltransferase family protein [Kosakonia sacchari]
MDLALDNQTKSQVSQVYRKDIDGLRAVAVVLVILFHAGVSLFPSGFIGVDIFFTISGFLITGKVISDIERNKYSITNFIAGRLWRLQPALITTMLATCIVASYCYMPADYEVFTKSAKYTALFLSNQFFDKQSATYASPDADYFLLLHTWSLAIEWQWYLFFALFAALLTVLINKSAIRVTRKSMLCGWLVLTFIATVILLVTSLFTYTQHYYSLTMRAFEFLIGGSTALLIMRLPPVHKILSNILAASAIAIIVWIAGERISVDFYPNTWTLLVCGATALLFLSRNAVVNNFLELAPVNYTGKISYSLYLWHWPVFAIFNYLGYALTGKSLFVALIITCVMAVICYHGIENRLRRVRVSFVKSVVLLVLVPVVVTMTLFSVTEKTDGLPQRFSAEYNRSFQLLHDATDRATLRFDCHGGNQILADCHFGDYKGTKKAFLIGDSNANHFWGFYDVLGKDAGVKMYSLSTSTCLALPGIYQFDWWKYKGIKYEKCHNNTQKYYDYIKKNHYDSVIISQVWGNYFGPYLINHDGDERSVALSSKRYEDALRSALQIITAAGSKPIIMFTIARMPENYQSCINQHVIHRYPFDINECDNQNPGRNNGENVMEMMNRMKREFPTLTFIDSKSIQCVSGKCVSNVDGVTVYRDEGHLTDYASYRFGQMYIEQFGNPLK